MVRWETIVSVRGSQEHPVPQTVACSRGKPQKMDRCMKNLVKLTDIMKTAPDISVCDSWPVLKALVRQVTSI